jgi:hypothetical protein
VNRVLSLVTAGVLVLDPGGPNGEGFQHGRTAGVQLAHSKIVISGDGVKGGKNDGYQLKRPCWYEPGPGADDMLKTQEDVRALWFRMNPQGSAEDFERFLKQFKDKIGKPGRWWTPAYNEADARGRACWGGLDTFVWVPPGTTPPSGITRAELAEIARAALTVPEPRIRLNPDAKSYVNLPTWVWLEDPGQATRSVTAAIPGVMSATVTATRKDLEIDPGTTAARAEVREECGAAGRPYARGAEFTCGVRYRRAAADQARKVYVMTVTTVWTVASDAVSFAYAPIRVGAGRDVPVGEVQSTVKP